MRLTRAEHIPQNAIKIETVDGIEIFEGSYFKSGEIATICFVGKTQKPTWVHYFKSEQDKNHKIKETVEKYQVRKKFIIEDGIESRRQKSEAIKTIDIGDIFVEVFCYENTTATFWQVVSKSQGKIELKELYHKQDIEEKLSLYEVMPSKNDFYSEIIQKMSISYASGDTIYLSKVGERSGMYHSIRNWNGKPVAISGY